MNTSFYQAVRSRVNWWVYTLLSHPVVVWPLNKVISFYFHDRISSRGVLVDTSGTIVVPWVKGLLFWGFYEAPEIRFVQQYLRNDLDVVELGSSLGVVSAHIARRLEPAQRMICVEANPTLQERIRTNVNLNAPNAHVTVINAAVDYASGHQGTVAFELGQSNLSAQVLDHLPASDYEQVATTTLKTLLSDANFDTYALISDIEGAEAGMILYDATALSTCQQLIIELHPTTLDGRTYSIDELCEMLQDMHGFVLRDQHRAVFVFDRTA